MGLQPSATSPSAALQSALPDSSVTVRLRPRFQPTALYSATRGFGIGGGVNIDHLAWEGSQLQLGARLSQRFQSGSAYLYSGDPYTTPLYGFFGAQMRTSTRQGFYGLGPFSDRDDKINLDFTSARPEVRVGWYPLGHSGLLLQPGGRFLWDRLGSFEDADDDAATLADTTSLAPLRGDTRYGLALGIQVSSDTRDRLVLTRRGVLVEAAFDRFFALDGSDLRFNQVQVRFFGLVPFYARRTVFITRAVAVTTRADNDPDGTGLPFFYQPALDDALLPGYPAERFFGRDILALGAGVRFPVIDLFGVLGLDGLVMVDVGSAYSDITDQFSFEISLDNEIEAADGGQVPLRPSLALGLDIINLDQDKGIVGGLLGISPEGITVTGFRVVYDFRDLQPLFR